MGVTEVLSNFTRIFSHNSVIVHRIATKFGTEIYFKSPFKCATFQLVWSMGLCLWWILQSVQNENNEEIKTKL